LRYETGMLGNGAAGASYGDLLVTSLIVLGVVCLAAFAVVRLASRVLAPSRTRGAHVLEVVARLPLEPRRSLYVVEVAGKTLLVGTSEMGLSLLTELDAGEIRARAVERPSFGELVRAAWLRRRSPRRSASPRGDLRAEIAPSAAAVDLQDPATSAAADLQAPAAMLAAADSADLAVKSIKADSRERSVLLALPDLPALTGRSCAEDARDPVAAPRQAPSPGGPSVIATASEGGAHADEAR
jgi:flagellar protein FliO/FliZ